MEPNRREFIKQCAFQKFCNTVLHNEACDAHKELHRHKAREITFSDLTLEEARQLHTFDEYFKGEIAFERAGKKITPKLLLEAIRTLPEEKRKAVLLYYFEGMNDTAYQKQPYGTSNKNRQKKNRKGSVTFTVIGNSNSIVWRLYFYFQGEKYRCTGRNFFNWFPAVL